MDYIKTFNEIVEIMHKDYSGCIDKRSWDNPEFYRCKITSLIHENGTNKRKFYDLVQQYLLAFKDYHIFFHIEGLQKKMLAVSVRRYEDKLYVTESQNPDFKKGDIIIKLGSDCILKAREKHKNFFFETQAERESWYNVLGKYKNCCVISASGELSNRKLKHVKGYPYGVNEKYAAQKINENTLYMKLPHFNDEGQMKSFINDNLNSLENCKNLIIDVRVNSGGSDIVFFPLLKYILPDRVKLSEISSVNGEIAINYTKRNCEGRIAFLKTFLNDVDEATKKYLLSEIEDLKQKTGKGFLNYETEINKGDEIFNITGQSNPENIVVLSDTECGSSGDAFVEACKKSKKVKIIGRPTLGITDYSNLNIIEIDDLTLYYPTSRDSRIDGGQGLNGKGVDPDIYIPWTPLHLEKDLDLEYALDFLRSLYS